MLADSPHQLLHGYRYHDSNRQLTYCYRSFQQDQPTAYDSAATVPPLYRPQREELESYIEAARGRPGVAAQGLYNTIEAFTITGCKYSIGMKSDERVELGCADRRTIYQNGASVPDFANYVSPRTCSELMQRSDHVDSFFHSHHRFLIVVFTSCCFDTPSTYDLNWAINHSWDCASLWYYG